MKFDFSFSLTIENPIVNTIMTKITLANAVQSIIALVTKLFN